MTGITVWVAAILLGVDAGWQPRPEGGMEYTIQIEPGTLESMKAGVMIESDVPPEVRDIRTYRVVVGTEPLPRKLPEKPLPSRSSAVPPATETHWPPLEGLGAARQAASTSGRTSHFAARSAGQIVGRAACGFRAVGRHARPGRCQGEPGRLAGARRGGQTLALVFGGTIAAVCFAGRKHVSRLDYLGRAEPLPPAVGTLRRAGLGTLGELPAGSGRLQLPGVIRCCTSS